jgi:hypothetical protein
VSARRPRVVFVLRAAARLALVEAGEMDLAEAYSDLIKSVCDCRRWSLAERGERTHPPRKYRGWRR